MYPSLLEIVHPAYDVNEVILFSLSIHFTTKCSYPYEHTWRRVPFPGAMTKNQLLTEVAHIA